MLVCALWETYFLNDEKRDERKKEMLFSNISEDSEHMESNNMKEIKKYVYVICNAYLKILKY